MIKDSQLHDGEVAQKARTNSDLIKLCSKPVPLYYHPIASGIGLFTHVAGPKTVARNPHFTFADKCDGEVALLPLGGPKRIAPSKLREPPNKELAAIYKELQDAIKAEEKIWSDMRAAADEKGEAANDAYRMSLSVLLTKYGDLDTTVSLSATENGVPAKRRHSEAADSGVGEVSKQIDGSSAPQSAPRRQSTSDLTARGRSTAAQRQQSTGRSGNKYDVHRDPRRRR